MGLSFRGVADAISCDDQMAGESVNCGDGVNCRDDSAVGVEASSEFVGVGLLVEGR
jgi:hypothetical protein